MNNENNNQDKDILTVSEISSQIKHKLEQDFGLVKIKGEISGFKKHSSGHLYFNLKDENAVISAICWRGNASKNTIKPEEGLEVVCLGKITTYQGRSQYQIIVDKIESSGEGALLKLLLERKNKLAKEGLFDLSRKKKLPLIPWKIGIITSPTGSVIKDIIHRIEDRFPRHLLLWATPVQGDEASKKIVEAIVGFNKIKNQDLKPDVIIIARGGGSFEDLWPFNDEELVRAVASSSIPIISAVGHETDTTLVDYAADVRAPTPTAAAEMVVPVRLELLTRLKNLETRKLASWQKLISERFYNVKNIARALPKPQYLIGELWQLLDDKWERLANSAKILCERKNNEVFKISSKIVNPINIITSEKMKIEQINFILKSYFDKFWGERNNFLTKINAELENCSFMNILKRGFVLVKDNANQPIISSVDVKKQPEICLTFYDGCVNMKTGKGLRRNKKDDNSEVVQEELF